MEICASSNNITPFSVLIASAGSGSRLGGERPKQYQKIAGKEILRHTIEAFLSCPGLKDLSVIIDPEHRTYYDQAVIGLDLPEPINGGSERNISIFNGLNNFSNLKNEDIILIHDAARPFVKRQDIESLVHAVHVNKAATLAVAVSDTQKYEDGDYVERDNLWAIQTPQGFHYGLIKKAHEQANKEEKYTDDTSLVAALGHHVEMVKGTRENMKITTSQDLDLACKLLSPAFETRTGFGYDVHAFTEGDKVRLCGIDIPHNKSLKGHSDADAGLHALTDALLGCIGAGDIGTHFPPDDQNWKDKDSAHFLDHAINLVTEKGGLIVNLDITLICEEPKISPHVQLMKQRIADLSKIDQERISIKATTTEKLGFIGRAEGIAAQAVASVRFAVKV